MEEGVEQKNVFPHQIPVLRRRPCHRDYIIDLVTCVEPELSQGRLTIAVFMDIKRAYDVMRTSDQVCYGARSTTAHGDGSSASSKENNILFSLLPVIAPNMPSSRVLRKGVY